MKLYHGSKNLLKQIENRQAEKGESEVPKDELLNGIYLTSDYGFAVAMAARPDGETFIDDEKNTISFKEPKLFNSEENLYIYSFNLEDISKENIKSIDNHQYVVLGVNSLPITDTEMIKAKKVFDYYELTNWKDNKEENNELNNTFKIKLK